MICGLNAAPSPYVSGQRIAISADGNPDADRDDIGATPMTLAVLAKAGLQDSLVHYDFNNWLEYKKINPGNNNMWIGAMGGQTRWGFDRSKFFDAHIDPEGAINNLAAEINKSTAANPLFIIEAGPAELIYQAMSRANNAARAHVTIVSHSGYNDYFKPRLWQNNLDEVLALNPNITYIKIPDQNGGLRTQPNYAPWHWLRDHADPNLRWVYQRMDVGLADVSDTGMITWLLGVSGNNDTTTIAELQAFFGTGLIPTNGGSTNAPAPPAGVDPVVNLPVTESIFQEVDGRIIIEAESVPLDGDWIYDTTEPGYTGTSYIRYMPSWIGAIDSQSKGVLIYKLRITNPGKYRMALKHSHKGAPERDKWNDCWTLMGIDIAPYGSIRKTYHSINDTQFHSGVGFTYTTTHDNYGVIAQQDGHFSQPLYDLEAGDHYFFIVGRSGGYRLDKIHFVREGVSGFKNDSLAPTPILPGDGVPAENAVSCGLLPTSIESAASFDVEVSYGAETERDIVVEFWNGGVWLGATRQTVSAGSGTATITLTPTGNAPAPGDNYEFKVSNRPVGGAWNAEGVVRCGLTNVTVTSTIEAESSTSFSPIDDAYLDNGTRYNDTLLKVEDGRRVSYLKFNVTGIVGTISNATLRMSVTGDAGSGTIRVLNGSSNDWTEGNLSTTNAPTTGTQFSAQTGTMALGSVVDFDLGTSITANGTYTFVLEMNANGNDVWFSSSEGDEAPELIVTSLIENDAPTIDITAPGDNALFRLGSTVTINCDANDDGVVSFTKVHVDGDWRETQETDPYSFSLENLEVGTYQIECFARDDQAKWSSDTISIEIADMPEPNAYSPLIIEPQGGLEFSVMYPHTPAGRSQFESSTDLKSWTPIGTPFNGLDGIQSRMVSMPEDGSVFVRVRELD